MGPNSPDPPALGPGPQSASNNEAILDEAIEDAPAAALKNLVRQLLAQVPQSRPVIDAALLRPLNNNNNNNNNGLKRKAHETCENCHASYLVEHNQVGVCRYHPRKYFFLSWIATNLFVLLEVGYYSLTFSSLLIPCQ